MQDLFWGKLTTPPPPQKKNGPSLILTSWIHTLYPASERITSIWTTSKYLSDSQHFFMCVREHLSSDKASHISKHLQNSQHCRTLCSADCFHVLDHASSSFQLQIKEAIHIQREQPSFNQQLHHLNLKLSL